MKVTLDRLHRKQDKIAVVGLGYVGLPLAVQLAHHFDVIGYDLKNDRIEALRAGHDQTLEVSDQALADTTMQFTSRAEDLSACRLIIVAVPTPIDAFRIPDLRPLRGASKIVGQHLSPGACVVFESTVYPGATEEVCVPLLASQSGLEFGIDFTVGYSPERINPGDKVHTIESIIKIIAGSDQPTLELLAGVYGKIVKAGLHQVSSIKVAEAAKVIENTQRDLNIALMNELAMIFDKLNIDTTEVLEAAGTKWNFLPFTPGLVGGHCIGVDPYYLTFKAEALGYHPEMILAGRRINDTMGKYVAERVVKMLIARGKAVRGAQVALLGLTFKEDVPDLRNSKVIDIVHELTDYGVSVRVHDPLADPNEARQYYGIDLVKTAELGGVDAVVIAVRHRGYQDWGLKKIAGLCAGAEPVVIDIKGMFTPQEAKRVGVAYWRL